MITQKWLKFVPLELFCESPAVDGHLQMWCDEGYVSAAGASLEELGKMAAMFERCLGMDIGPEPELGCITPEMWLQAFGWLMGVSYAVFQHTGDTDWIGPKVPSLTSESLH